MAELVKWYDFGEKGDERGLLSIVEARKDIQFSIDRVYYIYDTKEGVTRGYHAHRELQQVLIAVNGSCDVMLDNGTETEIVRLDSRQKGLAVDPWVWHEMSNFTNDCVLLCLASEHYDEADYIRDYAEFKASLKVDNELREVKKYLKAISDSDCKVQLRLCEVSDAEFILSARQDESKSRYISKTSTSLENQREWLREYKKREAAGDELYFVVCSEGQDVGLARMYGYRGDEFCWGSWIMLPNAPSTAAYSSAMMIYEIGFFILGMKSAYSQVRHENEAVWKFNERCGAELESMDDIDRHYNYPKENYMKLRVKWKKFLPNIK